MLPEGIKKQFANTFKEWHYLVNGFAMGLIVGFSVGIYITAKILKERARS